MVAPAAALVREKQAGLAIRPALRHHRATMAVMALLTLHLMQRVAAVVLARREQPQQIPTAATAEMARPHPFLAHQQRMRVVAAAPRYLAPLERAALAAVALAESATELGRELREQSTPEAVAGVVIILMAALAAPVSSSSNTLSPSNLS
jgi:hypothetical protein